jgi:DNA-binding transcriptional LysR family regulator
VGIPSAWRWTAPFPWRSSPLIAAFYQQQPLTRLHFTLNPSLLDWRPLTDGQADLLLGALGEPPPLSGYDIPLGELELLLVVSRSIRWRDTALR